MCFSLIILLSVTGCGNDMSYKKEASQQSANSSEQLQNKKILVAYFSWSGHTRKVAEQIHKEVGGDIFEIKTVKEYPKDHENTSKIAKKEQDENLRPQLSGQLPDMSKYDIIILGYPIWWYTAPMAINTFLESSDVKGKTILPFCTTGGTEIDQSVADIRKLVKNATVNDGLTILNADDLVDLDPWLKKSGIL